MAQPNPVAADPGDAGSHGGEVEEEARGTEAGTGGYFREICQVSPGKIREARKQSRQGERRHLQEEIVALVAEVVVVLADEGGVDSAEETQLWQGQVAFKLLSGIESHFRISLLAMASKNLTYTG